MNNSVIFLSNLLGMEFFGTFFHVCNRVCIPLDIWFCSASSKNELVMLDYIRASIYETEHLEYFLFANSLENAHKLANLGFRF